MTLILAGAAIISMVLGLVKPDPSDPNGWVADVVIIFGVLILNAIIGTVQETKAEKALKP
jgi:magnesium-transporting ATPase (P-type)